MPQPTSENESSRERVALLAFRIAWMWLLYAAGVGALMRLAPYYWPEAWNFGYLRHTHSHLAFLGWVFNAYFALSVRHFAEAGQIKAYATVFWAMQATLVGMAITFPLQGYAAGSIVFSTLHLIASAFYANLLWRSRMVTQNAKPWLRLALIWMLLSALGPFVLGPLAALDLRTHPAYNLSIYFYLHCQYNGWFIFFLIALLVHHRDQERLRLEPKQHQRALLIFSVGTALGYSISTLWLEPPWWVWAVTALSSIAQLYGAWELRALLKTERQRIPWLLRLAILVPVASFVLKLVMQLLASYPPLLPLSMHRYTVIGYLHLIFLGLVTPAIWAWAYFQTRWFSCGKVSLIGGLCYLLGMAISELVLATTPISSHVARFSSGLLFGCSVLILVGLALAMVGLISRRPHSPQPPSL